MNMLSKTKSFPSWRFLRSSNSIFKYSSNERVPQIYTNKRLNLCFHIQCPLSDKLNQSTCRTIYSKACQFQREISKPLDEHSEMQSPNKPKWSKVSLKSRYITKEEKFYHDALEQLDYYTGTIYKHDPEFLETYKISDSEYESIVGTDNWGSKLPKDVIKSFISVGVYASKKPNLTIEDRQFESMISSLIEKLALSTDEQLINCLVALKYWPLLQNVADPQILKVWKELDDVCFKRSIDWSIDKNLFMMDLWYQLGLTKSSFFVFKGLSRVSRKTDEFTAAQMIQSLFYLSCKQSFGPSIAIREYEYHIQKYITKLSMEEIGIFAIAFFKTKTSILNKKILIYLMQRTVEEAETVDKVVLTSIAKAVRFSHKPDIGFTANDMVTKIIEKRWNTLSLTCAIHLVHVGTQIQFFNEEALTKIAEKFCDNPCEGRLKDLERIAFFLSLFNFIPPSTPNIGQLMSEQLSSPAREWELRSYPLICLSLLYYLSLLQVFPEKQIKEAISEKCLLERYDNKFTIPQQAVQLDYNRVLEGPPGSAHLLSPNLREYLARRYSLFIPDKNYRAKSEFDKLLSEVMELTDEYLGKENNLTTYTLPHFPRADILFRLDDSGNPLPIPEEMKSLSPFEDVHRPIGPGKWYCVMIGGRNMYMHNVPRLVGEQTTKLRQLKVLGYTPIVIPSYYWKQEQDKMAYLKLKYLSAHEQNK